MDDTDNLTIIESYTIKGKPEIEDGVLAKELPEALGMSLSDFTLKVLRIVREEIKGKVGSELTVRCYRADGPKHGICLKSISVIVLGFMGDVKDFTITMIHELLHMFKWEERATEAKAKRIYKKRFDQ